MDTEQLEALHPAGETTHTRRIMDHLVDVGLWPELDEDGDIRLKYEGWPFWVLNPERDVTHLQVAHPNFWPLDDEQERRCALEVAARVQGRFRVGRLTVTGDNVWASVEAYLPDELAFQGVLLRNLSALQALVAGFVDEMRAERKD